MRKTKRSFGFFLSLLINIFLNPEGFIPAVILVVMHFWKGWSIWWAVLAAGVWILWLTVRMLLLGWVTKCSNTPDPPKENKNPYSSGKYNSKK